MDVTTREMQDVVCFRIRGKPVFAVDLLAPGGESREQIILALFLANIWNRLAVSLHNLKIVIVHPDSALEVALLTHDLFGSKIEDVGVQFVLLLLANVKNLILRNFVGAKYKGQAMPDIVNVFGRH